MNERLTSDWRIGPGSLPKTSSEVRAMIERLMREMESGTGCVSGSAPRDPDRDPPMDVEFSRSMARFGSWAVVPHADGWFLVLSVVEDGTLRLTRFTALEAVRLAQGLKDVMETTGR